MPKIDCLPGALYTAQQVRELDRQAIERFGIPGSELMRRAGAAAFALLQARWPRAGRICVLVGTGNNGGDGFVLARLARQAGLTVQVLQLGERARIAGDALLHARAWEETGGAWAPFQGELPQDCDLFVDAMLGTGLRDAPRGDYRQAVEALNAHPAPVLAIDIPTGLDADRGTVLGAAVQADATLSFIGLKRGLFTGDAVDCCGEIHFDALEVPAAVYASQILSARRVDWAQQSSRIAPRRRSAHKGHFGRVLVVGGEHGMGGAVRLASIPFGAQGGAVASFVPLLFYQGDVFYMDGVEGGATLYEADRWRVRALGRLRFFDIPDNLQNLIQGDTVDWGGQVRYRLGERAWLNAEWLTDQHFAWHANLGLEYAVERGDLELWPRLNARYKSARFNSTYYALDWAGFPKIGGGVDLQAGFRFRYHLRRQLYLIGAAQFTALDSRARKAPIVRHGWQAEAWTGVAFFNDRSRPMKRRLRSRPYLRLAHGWGTPSSVGEILTGRAQRDPHHNQLTSIFYGVPVADELFGIPLDIYITPGFVWHWSSGVQDAAQEYVVAIKAYYTLPIPRVRVRAGIAEGFSYITKVTWIERTNNAKKGYIPSNLLNYLDFSLDVSLGDIFRTDMARGIWLGYSIHHRSAIFETAQHFGRISGGSNYQTLYLQYEF
jgi:outer membrane protein